MKEEDETVHSNSQEKSLRKRKTEITPEDAERKRAKNAESQRRRRATMSQEQREREKVTQRNYIANMTQDQRDRNNEAKRNYAVKMPQEQRDRHNEAQRNYVANMTQEQRDRRNEARRNMTQEQRDRQNAGSGIALETFRAKQREDWYRVFGITRGRFVIENPQERIRALLRCLGCNKKYALGYTFLTSAVKGYLFLHLYFIL